jgi:hypothetical protein
MRVPFPFALPRPVRPASKPQPQPQPTTGHGDPNPPPAPSILRIPPDALGDIRATEALIDQHTRIVRALERDLAATVANSCNVDLQHEHWELDSRHGLIERRD